MNILKDLKKIPIQLQTNYVVSQNFPNLGKLIWIAKLLIGMKKSLESEFLLQNQKTIKAYCPID